MPNISFYPYEPNRVLPAIFATIIALSLSVHIFQNFRYHYWRTTFFLTWGGLVFTSGWILRAISTQNPANLPLYISQTVLILAGPPIYAAAEYNILSRLMNYLPMHATLNPNRVVLLFIYIGAAVEALTAAGAAKIATHPQPGTSENVNGGRLISISLVLQGIVEIFFLFLVWDLHRKSKKSKMLSPNILTVFIMLYGTASLIFLRCIFRAVESFSKYKKGGCDGSSSSSLENCGNITNQEYYLYIFEATPMVLYTLWLNLIHPGRFLPANPKRYLDLDGQTEREGPGWIDNRSRWLTFVDLFDVRGAIRGRDAESEFWKRPDEGRICVDGSFALGTASNRRRRYGVGDGERKRAQVVD
ncbi:MAG: hypothetical protein M1812_001098 [Candelaria pacifica]|nr:MAG: hypothetical protein M1812_001098 [Candelaria pacifica]